jgi:hypothetical protein
VVKALDRATALRTLCDSRRTTFATEFLAPIWGRYNHIIDKMPVEANLGSVVPITALHLDHTSLGIWKTWAYDITRRTLAFLKAKYFDY